MTLESMNCCAVKEIHDLQDHKTPRSALVAFLNQFFRTGYDKGGNTYYKKSRMMWGYVPAFIIFTEIVSTHYTGDQQDFNASFRKGYGKKFADFIRSNKLGEVSTITPQRNRVNCPNHHIQPYIWHPDLDTLKAWVKKNNPRLTNVTEW